MVEIMKRESEVYEGESGRKMWGIRGELMYKVICKVIREVWEGLERKFG